MQNFLLTLRRATRLLLMPVVVLLAVLFFLVEDVSWPIVSALAARLARLPAIARIEAWIARRGPYPTLLLITIPFVVLEPLKLYGLYLMGFGHIIYGIIAFLFAEIVRTAIAARIFTIGRAKLLSIVWFTWVYGGIMDARDWAYSHLTLMPAWQMAQRLLKRLRQAGQAQAGHVTEMQRDIARRFGRGS